MSIEETMRATLDEVRALRQEVAALAADRGASSVTGRKLISYEAAGAIADVKPGTISAWTRLTHIRRYGTTRKPLVDEAELRAYLERNKTAPAVDPDDSAAAMLARRKR